MFCEYCGAKLDDHVTKCPCCGAVARHQADSKQHDAKKIETRETNTIAIIGFAVSLFIPFIGLILSIIGLQSAKKLGGAGKEFAIAGIVIGLIPIVFIALFIIISIAVTMSVL